jgi:hypothetical protein
MNFQKYGIAMVTNGRQGTVTVKFLFFLFLCFLPGKKMLSLNMARTP